jgi:hypothetical protein
VEPTLAPATVAPTPAASPTTGPQKSERIKSKTRIEAEGFKADITIEADVTQTADCGYENCFEEKFAACQAATLQADAGALGSFEYKIIGPVTGGCKVTMKYPSNPNPEWVNKELTCVLDNKIDLEESVGNTFDGILDGTVVCEGLL